MKTAAISFLSTEQSDDLIVSFAVGEFAETSITFIRTPMCEALFPEEERGVSVDTGEIEVEHQMLVAIEWGEEMVEFETTTQRMRLDICAVSKSEVVSAKETFRKMNFDNRFSLKNA